MEGKAFLNTAQKLTQIRDEPALRSAVSRAYYAVYNCCIRLLEEFGIHFDKDYPAHEKVYQYLRNSAIAEIETTADDLRLLRKRRNMADYDMASKEFQSHLLCQGDVVRAQGIILQIEKHSKEPLRTQLRKGLRDYHAKINPKSSERS
jgi:hypothetical protein